MVVDGERLILSLNMQHDEIVTLFDFIKPRLEYIDIISIENMSENLTSSLLIQLLISIKKSKPSMEIALLDENKPFLEYGTFKWSGNDR